MSATLRAKKLVLFGDSLLARLSKPAIQKLETKLPNHLVYNCAAGGWDTTDGVAKAAYIAQLQPDVVVLSFGMNDSAPWKMVQKEAFRNNLERIITAFAGTHCVLFPPPPVGEQDPQISRSNTLIQQYTTVMQEVAEKLSVDTIDSWKIYPSLTKKGENYHEPDGVHLNDLGKAKLIDAISKIVLASTHSRPRPNRKRTV